MKKIFFLTLIFSAIFSSAIFAQAGDPPSMLDQMKEKFVQPMVAKTGITEAQAIKIVEINYEMRQSMANAKDLTDEQRKAKITELKADRDKKWAEVLSADQIVAVKNFYEEMGKNMQKKPGK